MSEEKKIEQKTEIQTEETAQQEVKGGAGKGGGKRLNRFNKPKEKEEFDQKIIDLARVTRVMAGGKRMSFRACVAIGDHNGQVAVGIAKGADVTDAIAKAVNQAKKDIVKVSFKNDTIIHSVNQKFGASKILFKPAQAGHGVIAGGVVKMVLELSGVKNISSKILGGSNRMNHAKCALEALRVFNN